MKSLFNRNEEQQAAAEPTARPTALTLAERACCCPGKPAVSVIMPPRSTRPRDAELLLCGHHFRVSQEALRAAGATVYDETGQLVCLPGDPVAREDGPFSRS